MLISEYITPVMFTDSTGYSSETIEMICIGLFAVLTVAAIICTAGGAAVVLGPLLSAYTAGILGSGAILAAGYTLASLTIAFAINDIITISTGTNHISNTIFSGNDSLYSATNMGIKMLSFLYIGIGVYGNSIKESNTIPKYPGNNTTKIPKGYEWRGTGQIGSSQGNFYNPETGEILHPDLNHPLPIGPHWDYRDPNGEWYRIFIDYYERK